MSKRSFFTVTVWMLAMSSVVLAQSDSGDRDGDAGVEGRAPRRGRMAAMPGAAGRQISNLNKLHDDMKERLDLDDDQVADIDGLFDEYLETFRDKRADRADQLQDVRELIRELRQAREDGDDARVAEIREQITAAREAQKSPVEANHDEFLDHLREMLYDDQLENFEKLVEAFRQRAKRGDQTGFAAVQRMRRAAETIDLEPEQKEAIRQVFREIQGDVRDAGRDPKKMEDLEAAIHDAIIDELDDQQADAFERKLEELEAKERAQASAREPGRRSAPAVDRGDERNDDTTDGTDEEDAEPPSEKDDG